MDYGYDKAKEDDLEERRLRHKPRKFPLLPKYTPEQLNNASSYALESLIGSLKSERRRPHTPKDIAKLDRWIETINRLLPHAKRRERNETR